MGCPHTSRCPTRTGTRSKPTASHTEQPHAGAAAAEGKEQFSAAGWRQEGPAPPGAAEGRLRGQRGGTARSASAAAGDTAPGVAPESRVPCGGRGQGPARGTAGRGQRGRRRWRSSARTAPRGPGTAPWGERIAGSPSVAGRERRGENRAPLRSAPLPRRPRLHLARPPPPTARSRGRGPRARPAPT